MTSRPRYRDSSLRTLFVRGFTLVELVVIVAVMGVLLSLAAPSFTELIAAQRVRLTASDLYAALIMARSEAMKRNTTATVTATGGDWQNGWTAQSAGTTLQTQAAPTGGVTVVALTALGAATTIVTYASNGRPQASIGVRFTVSSSSATSVQPRCITLSLSGMPQMKTDTNGNAADGC